MPRPPHSTPSYPYLVSAKRECQIVSDRWLLSPTCPALVILGRAFFLKGCFDMKIQTHLSPITVRLLAAALHVAGAGNQFFDVPITFRPFTARYTQVVAEVNVNVWTIRIEVDQHEDYTSCTLSYRPTFEADRYPWVICDSLEAPDAVKAKAMYLNNMCSKTYPSESIDYAKNDIVTSPQGDPVLRN